MFSHDELSKIREYLAETEVRMTYMDMARDLGWRLGNGKLNVSRVWRAVQRIKRDTAAAKGVKSFSTKDVVTVGDAVALAISVLKSIPRSAYMIPMGYADETENDDEK